MFHLEYHRFGEFVLTDLKELMELWWIDFFIFRSYEESGDTNQVELAFLNVLFAHKLVDDELANVERLRSKSELTMNIDNPLDKECSRGVLDFCLNRLQIVMRD